MKKCSEQESFRGASHPRFENHMKERILLMPMAKMKRKHIRENKPDLFGKRKFLPEL